MGPTTKVSTDKQETSKAIYPNSSLKKRKCSKTMVFDKISTNYLKNLFSNRDYNNKPIIIDHNHRVTHTNFSVF